MGLAIVCAGQGVQTNAMFADFVNQAKFASYLQLLEQHLSIKITANLTLNAIELFADKNAQLLIPSCTYLQWLSIKGQLNTAPMAFSGYSLGELSAYALTGGLDFATLLDVAKTRANLMDNCVMAMDSGMLAIQHLPLLLVQQIANECNCYISIINGEQQVIIGGINANILRAKDLCAFKFPMAKTTLLKVSLASHTPLLSQASTDFATFLVQQPWCDWQTPVVSGATGATIYNSHDASDTLALQLSHTLNFAKMVSVLVELGITTILELGPGTSLTKIIHQLDPSLKVRAYSEFSSAIGVCDWVNKQLDG